MKADKGAAASSFCPPPSWGFPSQSLQLTLKKKKFLKKALKESYRQLPKKEKTTHTHTQNPNRSPFPLPPPPIVSCFHFFENEKFACYLSVWETKDMTASGW